MITISEIVSQKIGETPYLEEALSEQLINVSSLARKLKPEIERQLKKPIKEGAIVMAINRLPLASYKNISNQVVSTMKNAGDIIVRSDLTSYSFLNSYELRKKQTLLLKQIENSFGIFYTLSQGVNETTIIISSVMEKLMQELFVGEKMLKKTQKLSSVIIKLPENNSEIPGLYYFILKNLAWDGVNINEVISTTNEFTIVVSENDIDKAFKVMMKIKKGS